MLTINNTITPPTPLSTCCDQSRLEECFKKQAHIQQALDVTKKETENEKENSRKAQMEWQCEREAMKEEISELRDNLRHNCEMLKKIEGKHKVQTGHPTRFLGVAISFLPPKSPAFH